MRHNGGEPSIQYSVVLKEMNRTCRGGEEQSVPTDGNSEMGWRGVRRVPRFKVDLMMAAEAEV